MRNYRAGLFIGLAIFGSLCAHVTSAKAEEADVALKAEATLKAQEAAATKDFLGLNWGFGIGVAGDLNSNRRVDSAKVVNGVVRVDETSQVQPRIFLEIHLLA